MKKLTLKTLALLLAAVTPTATHAASISLIGNDASGFTSFNTSKNWADGNAPSAANDYYTAGFYLRTPGDANSYTFAGASLTLGALNLSGGVNGSMLDKFSPPAGSVRTLTINNFTNLANSMIRSGGTAGALVHIAGNHYTIAGSSILQADQCIWVIDSPLLGASSIILTNYANNANDHVAYTANNSGFTGSLYLTGAGTSSWSLELDAINSVPGNPPTFNPGQITFLGTGQLRDTVGCTLTNSNGGITLTANGTINTSATTLIGEPITDLTNGVHSVALLTSSGSGTLIFSNANNNYSGGTTISAGTLQLGAANSIPGNTIAGDVTDNGILDLNTYSETINGLNGTGAIDTVAGGSPTLTIGANGDNGTFSGYIQNSTGTLTLIKVGAGTETLSGSITYSGNTVVAGGTLNLSTASGTAGTPGSMIVSNGASLTVNASSGATLPANNVLVATNGSLSLTLNSGAIGLSANGSLTLQDNATNTLAYGTVSGDPTAVAINVAGSLATPGSNIVINITATGLQPGTFTLIKYTGTALASIANFQLSPPPGVAATLVNDTVNDSIDLQITSIPNQLSWNGVNGKNWDLTTANWLNDLTAGITVYKQYTNGTVIAGDSVLLDDTLTNDYINPQPTNINLTAQFNPFPVFFNSSLPYSIAGAGGIRGVTSLVLSNTGSLTLLTSNSFTGGVSINGSTLIITNDSALGASSVGLVLDGGTLQMNGSLTNNRAIAMPVAGTIDVATNDTVGLTGVISGAGASFNKTDNGTLILTAKETFTGDMFLHGGLTVIDSGGSITNTSYHDVGQNTTDSATLTMRGTGAFSTTSDFNLGDLDSSIGTLNMSGSATLVMNAFFIGSANAAGSTAMGTVNQSGGTITEISAAVGEFCIGGRNSPSGVGTYNMSGGTLTANAGVRVGSTGIGTLNQTGGTINAMLGLNIARIAGSFGTNNLNGGILVTYNVSSSTSSNAVFNFNGGTMRAGFTPATPWMTSLSQANILAGGAFIDSSNYNVTIAQPLIAGSANGGLTKVGTGTLTLTGTNTFTGPITNNVGTLYLNSPSTYAGSVAVNGGILQLTTASVIQGTTTVTNGALLSINQLGSASLTISNLTLNGGPTGSGATLGLTPTSANNPNVALINCGNLTLNGSNSVSLAAVNVGTTALIKYFGTVGGSGNITNLILPQGATGYVSNNAANATLYAVVTSTGPGLVWTGTNSTALNTWNIGTTTNWLVNSTPTSYHQIIIPGDSVIFNDLGSGTVLLNTNVSPAGLIISNSSKIYTFSGTGSVSGVTGVLKAGTSTAIVSVTNNNYLGATTISNGTLQVGGPAVISPAANLVVGPSGTLEMAGYNQSATELNGGGIVDNNSGIDATLTIGTSAGGTWNGSIQDHGHGGISVTKNGTGTWVVGGPNNLDNGTAFTIENIFAGGTTILTNGGSMFVPVLQTWIGNASTATMIVAGGSLSVTNNVLAVGYSTNANGTLIVNSGTVSHGGGPFAAFGAANNLEVGALGGTGTLIVNGGQVLNSQALWLGQNSSGSGTLYLNGGLVQATVVQPSGTPATSIAYFDGGTLQAVTNSIDFLQVSSMVMSNGLVLDDNGWSVTISSQSLQAGDSFNGGLIKKGSGTVYLDSGESYTGTTIVTNGTLAGIGTISGPVVVAPAGNLGCGDAGGDGGYFYINNNLTLQGNVTMRIAKDGGSPSQDQLQVSGNVTYGGILTVTNLTSDATLLANGDTFQVFNVSGSHSGNFTSIAGSPGTGLAYQFNPANGVLSVVTSTIANNPVPITATVNGSTLTMTWPGDHLGWILQSQTNAASVGLGANWVDVAGSSGSTNAVFNMNPANPTVFFRLRHP